MLRPVVHALALTLVVVATLIASPSHGAGATITRAQALEELAIVEEAITRMHPGVDRYISRGAFKTLVDRVKRGIGADGIDIEQWFMALTEITGAVCDEHTYVHFDHIDDDDPRRPDAKGFHEPLLFVDGEPYFAAASGRSVAGKRMTEIEGMSGNELYRALARRLSVDGCADARRVVHPGRQSRAMIAALVGHGPDYRVGVAGDDGGAAEEHHFAARSDTPEPPNGHGVGDVALLTELGFAVVANGGDLFYALNGEDSIGYLRLRNLKVEDEGALKAKMRRIIRDNPDDLIVDFQHNPGGLNTTTSLFLSFLLQRAHGFTGEYHVRMTGIPRKEHFEWLEGGRREFEKDMRQFRKRGKKRGGFLTLRARVRSFGNPDYDGRITVLIDAATGSAAGAAATILKQYRDVRIIGTEAHSSGEFFCFRPRGEYVLPYSRLGVVVPHMCATRTGAVAQRFDHAVRPDRFVDLTTDSLKNLSRATIRTAVEDIVSRRTTH